MMFNILFCYPTIYQPGWTEDGGSIRLGLSDLCNSLQQVDKFPALGGDYLSA